MGSNIINLSDNAEFNKAVGELRQINTGIIRHYYIYTFGCQMNVHDSEILSGILSECGFHPSPKAENADVILINTCCIRDHAEQKTLGLLGTLKELKAQNPSLVIGIIGCMTQQLDFAKKIKAKFPYVDIILGTNCADKLPAAVLNAYTVEDSKKRRTLYHDDNDSSIIENAPVMRSRSVTSWLNIMYGCNNFCTYCIVPYVRGRERSRSPEAILREVKELAENSTKEITLLGQNVNSYGKELDYSFARLIREINKVDGIERIRFMTSHPKDISDELISAFGECEKLCEHLHLPLQSGSDKILKDMNRKYDFAKYSEITKKLRQTQPAIEISTDIIVGFPGETDDDFKRTLDAVEEMRFSFAFMFAYSPRNGTKAAAMENQIPNALKKERLNTLIAKQNEISAQISSEYIGKTVEILSEGRVSDEDEDAVDKTKQMGRTRTNKKVYFVGDDDTSGKILHAKINNSVSVTLGGEIV